MLRKWSKGQGLTEFAIILPVLLITIFMIIETGRIFQAYVTVQNAARDGARYAITGQGGAERASNVKQAAKDILVAGLPLIEPNCGMNYLPEYYCITVWAGELDDAGEPGQRVQVEVTYNVRIITPILSGIAPIVPVKGRVEMINEPFGAAGRGHGGILPPTLGIPPTFTPTPTPVPITINEPLYAGDTVVTGFGDTDFDPLVQIWDWTTHTLLGTGNIQTNGTFRITVPPLIGGHTIRAIGSYGYDDAVVQTSPITPTSTPEPGSITVNKVVVGGGTALPSEWSFTIYPDPASVGAQTGPTAVFNNLPPGNYTISEIGPEGFSPQISGDCNDIGEVTVGPGESKICTFTNGPSPSIDIEKFTNGYDADSTVTAPTISIGDPVNWTYLVINNGTIPLSNVVVDDSQGGVVTCPQTSLGIGESMNCTVSGTAEAGQYQNLATASGAYGVVTVSDTDLSHYFGAVEPTPIRVNCGDQWDYTDTQGDLWEIDQGYVPGGWGYIGLLERVHHGQGDCKTGVGGTNEDDLYNSYDYGDFFGFIFDDFINGDYQINLLMVEPTFTSAGSRLFDVIVEGNTEITDVDIAGAVGSCNAYSRSINASVTDGQLNIQLGATTGEAIISGIEIIFEEFAPPPTPTPLPTHTPASTPTPTNTPVIPPDLTITDLSTQPGILPAWTPVTITTNVLNDSSGPCNEFFWTDLYVYTDTVGPPPPSRSGVAWQGLNSLGPHISTTLTFNHTFTTDGTHYLYSQADSFQFVNESDETNNVSQPLAVTVQYTGPTPTATFTPTPDPNCGAISGSVWAFIGGQLVVPSERVDMSLTQQGQLVDTAVTDPQGGYLFQCVSAGSGYTVAGVVEIGGILYVGSEGGIQVDPSQETMNIDVILYPLY